MADQRSSTVLVRGAHRTTAALAGARTRSLTMCCSTTICRPVVENIMFPVTRVLVMLTKTYTGMLAAIRRAGVHHNSRDEAVSRVPSGDFSPGADPLTSAVSAPLIGLPGSMQAFQPARRERHAAAAHGCHAGPAAAGSAGAGCRGAGNNTPVRYPTHFSGSLPDSADSAALTALIRPCTPCMTSMPHCRDAGHDYVHHASCSATAACHAEHQA